MLSLSQCSFLPVYIRAFIIFHIRTSPHNLICHCANCNGLFLKCKWTVYNEPKLLSYLYDRKLLTSGICPDCINVLYPEYAEKITAKRKEREYGRKA